MLHSLALTSSLILASAIAFNQGVLAENVDVPFSGTVPEQATFSTPTAPTISSDLGANPNRFESATPATLSVQLSTPATVTVSPPKLVSGPTPDPTGTTHVGFLKFASTNVSTDVGGGSARIPAGNTNLQVNLLVERPEAFQPGNYTYVVTLTMTP